MNGESANGWGLYGVSSAGDVNGDGLDDVVVSSPLANSANGAVYVVFGRTATGSPIELSALGAAGRGFAIYGQGSPNDWLGYYKPTSAGDVNGDGLSDLFLAAPLWTASGPTEAGRAYVVFGRTATTNVNLNAVTGGTGGFSINNPVQSGDNLGMSVSSLGDVNGDGLTDLALSAPYSDPAAGSNAGRTYVVFGRSTLSSFNASDVGAGIGGFVINGQCSGDLSGVVVSSAGDVNGDGLADILVGAGMADPAGLNAGGRAYVVFGRTGMQSVHLSAVATGVGGFVINGQCSCDRAGWVMSSVGDVNGDGLSDLAVTAHYARTAAGAEAGRAFVVFGRSAGAAAVEVSSLLGGSGGFVIDGEHASGYLGTTIASAGDVNGDGLADVIIGADMADPGGRANAGRSYVVFGRTGAAPINLSSVASGCGGFVIDGEMSGDRASRVSSAGDVNGDGFADLIVAAWYARPNGLTTAGRAYVIFGGQQFASTVDFLGDTSDNDQVGTAAAETFVAGAGSDTITGGGGADVMMGGAGHDVFVLNASNTAALAAGVAGGQVARVLGGGGIDTLRLSGGAGLDLSAISNVGAGSPDGLSRIEGIEKIDLATDTGYNSITLSARDLVDMSRMNVFNNGTVTLTSGSLGGLVQRHQLWVDGAAGDVVAFADGTWVRQADIATATQAYRVYHESGSAVQLIVDADVQVLLPHTPTPVPPINLSAVAGGSGGFAIRGQSAGDYSGRVLASAGDVNGDGLDDLIVGADDADPVGRSNAGRSYVVFGRSTGTLVDLSAVAGGSGGFVINGQCSADNSGVSVSAAGDLNGDGLADLIVGADAADPGARGTAGRAYVVYGRSASGAVSLSDVAAGVGGFAINGRCVGDGAGVSVSSAGDVNGDGIVDLVVGASGMDVSGRSNSGGAFVVFGRAGGAYGAVELSAVAMGSGGFVINGVCSGDIAGSAVSSAGDVNGDGLADLIVSAEKFLVNAPNGAPHRGRSGLHRLRPQFDDRGGRPLGRGCRRGRLRRQRAVCQRPTRCRGLGGGRRQRRRLGRPGGGCAKGRSERPDERQHLVLGPRLHRLRSQRYRRGGDVELRPRFRPGPAPERRVLPAGTRQVGGRRGRRQRRRAGRPDHRRRVSFGSGWTGLRRLRSQRPGHHRAVGTGQWLRRLRHRRAGR